MATKQLRPCNHPGCPTLVRDGSRCPKHAAEAAPNVAMYNNSKWRKARLAYLQANPLCVQCAKENRVTQANVVDHIVPHRGDRRLFWDKKNWQALCDYRSPFDCHGHKTGAGM